MDEFLDDISKLKGHILMHFLGSWGTSLLSRGDSLTKS